MSNIGSYEERLKNFDWSISEKELAYKAGDVINIGWYCSDRVCGMGKGEKLALLWENAVGEEKRYTLMISRHTATRLAPFSGTWA